jgi:DNA gyrase inhibitor GyrI
VKIILLVLIGIAAVLIISGCQFSRSGYETASYDVKQKDNDFEVREYPSLLVVETSMVRADDGTDGSFMRLFRYITGSNQQGQKIAMTTPVFMSEQEANPTMAFLLPKDYQTSNAPLPKDANVKISEIKSGRFAVLRFEGGRSSKNESAASARLMQWIEAQHLKSTGKPIFAYFDPPWTPSFLRRNEVMVRLEGSQ